MDLSASATPAPSGVSFGPWLFGPRIDLAVFGGSALVALGLVAAARGLGLSPGPLPEWGWLVLVLGIDVAHVHSTLFRTYLDGEELRRHPYRYALVPLAVYLVGVALYAHGSLTFWRVLAYVALFHFVRQQVGWVAVYRARSSLRGGLDRIIDDGAVYLATLYPVLHWHANLPDTRFAWFLAGDFVDGSSLLEPWVGPVKWLWAGWLALFFARQLAVGLSRGTWAVGKSVVVATTAAVWYVGIVATNSDFDFTVTNVIVHGVPYIALLWAYARARRREAPSRLGSHIAGAGFGAFLSLLLLIAFLEEWAWDELVWQERSWLFGDAGTTLGAVALALVVPLLALPQATHYALDGILWRRGDTRTRPAQRAALGFEP
ncbi:MAG: hypothetical protein KF718_09535 [Polyangiaceae bacterium]|nr:hypothetical protein [Polyangiaceae bacterium]